MEPGRDPHLGRGVHPGPQRALAAAESTRKDPAVEREMRDKARKIKSARSYVHTSLDETLDFTFNPFRTAVPLGDKNSSGLSPKRDCGSKGVNGVFYIIYIYILYMYYIL